MELLKGGENAGLFIDLGSCPGFDAMRAELERRLSNMNRFVLGRSITLNIGEQRLTERQFRELEDVLLAFGAHLGELVSSRDEEDKTRDAKARLRIPVDDWVWENAALICRQLRSGQKFRTEGSAVILGDVNPGAEVIAGRHILVMGALRGLAHAGYYGDESVFVAAYRLQPTQLRIAHHITRPPDGEDMMIHSPELARIRDGKVVIEKLKI